MSLSSVCTNAGKKKYGPVHSDPAYRDFTSWIRLCISKLDTVKGEEENLTSQRFRGAGNSDGGAKENLTSAQFHILVALADGGRYGYGIMQEVEERTEGVVELGPGTLYRSLRQLLDRGLIEEIDDPDEAHSDSGPPRRSYLITERGSALAGEKARRLRTLVRWADEALGLEGGQV